MEHFYTLTPDEVLDAIEEGLESRAKGNRATGRVLALNSIENRVYDIELEDSSNVVAKFYRPSRWSERQILDEHEFIERLSIAEVPVVPPLKLAPSHTTLGTSKSGIRFAIFPKIRGRLLDELDDSQIRQIGRLLARIHNVGEAMGQTSRLILNTENYCIRPLELILSGGFIEGTSLTRYESVVHRLIEAIAPRIAPLKSFLLHGDCHPGNILWTPQGNPFFVDFDDMVHAPGIQDLWMVVRGRDPEAKRQREELFTAYSIFRPVAREELKLVECFRAMRLVHYSAWIAKRWEDPSFPRLFPAFKTEMYWREEIEALEETLALIELPEMEPEREPKREDD